MILWPMEDASRRRVAAICAFQEAFNEKNEKKKLTLSKAERNSVRAERFAAGKNYVLTALSEGRADLNLVKESNSIFKGCVSGPTFTLRGRMQRAASEGREDAWSREKVLKKVNPFIESYREMADAALVGLTDRENVVCGEQKARWVGVVVAVCGNLSDCLKYVGKRKEALVALHVALCYARGSGLMHKKLALLAQCDIVGGGAACDLRAAYHFCVHMANDRVVLVRESKESELIEGLLHSVELKLEKRLDEAKEGNKRICGRGRFVSRFIVILSGLIGGKKESEVQEDFDAHEGELLKDLRECISMKVEENGRAEAGDETISDHDLVHLVGILMYARHRWLPLGDPEGAQYPERARLADRLVSTVMLCLIEQAEKDIRFLAEKMKNRDRRRRMKASKARKMHRASDANPVGVAATSAPPGRGEGEARAGGMVAGEAGEGFKVPDDFLNYADVYRKVNISRALGVLSFLAHYWSKTLIVSRLCPFGRYKEILDGLNRVTALLEFSTSSNHSSSAAYSSIASILGQANTAVQSAGSSQVPKSSLLPATPEDVAFASFRPCEGGGRGQNMFWRTRLPSASLGKTLAEKGAVSIGTAQSYFSEICFDEHLLRVPSSHLEAFSAQILAASNADLAKEVSLKPDLKAACSSLVNLGLQKTRLLRLAFRLSADGGGRIKNWQAPARSRGMEGSSKPSSGAERAGSVVPAKRQLDEGEDGDVEGSPHQNLIKRRKLSVSDTRQTPPQVRPLAAEQTSSEVVTPEIRRPAERPLRQRSFRDSSIRPRGREGVGDMQRPRMQPLGDGGVNSQAKGDLSQMSILLGQKTGHSRSQRSDGSSVDRKRAFGKIVKGRVEDYSTFLFYPYRKPGSSSSRGSGRKGSVPVGCQTVNVAAAENNPFLASLVKRAGRSLSESESQSQNRKESFFTGG